MADEVKVAPDVLEKLWDNLAPHFARGVDAVLGSRGKKKEAIEGLLKLAYQAGVQRGYDMGHEVFGDGE